MRNLNSLITHVGIYSWLLNFVFFIATEPDSQEFHCSSGLGNPFLNLEMYKDSKPQNNFFFSVQLLSTNEDGTFYSENCEHLNCYSHQISLSSNCCLPWQAISNAIDKKTRASTECNFPEHSSASRSSETSQAEVLSSLKGISDGFL